MIWFDPDKSGKGVRIASVGFYMFKVQRYSFTPKLYGKELTTQLEGQNPAQDREQARELVRDIIFNEAKGPNEWVNCFLRKDLNLTGRVDELQARAAWFNELTD